MSTLLFYRDQAAQQQSAADAASLDNVRDRCTRAAKAWTDLADRVERNDAARLARSEPAAAEPALAIVGDEPEPDRASA